MSRLAFAAGAVILTFQAALVFVGDVRDVESSGRTRSVIQEFGESVPVAQTFTMGRDGLEAVTIALSSDAPLSVSFTFELIRTGPLPGWPDEHVLKQVISLDKLAGVTEHTIEFPAVTRAKNRIFTALFQLIRVDPTPAGGASASRPAVSLVSWSDSSLVGGGLRVGPQERWGDLVFSARVEPATRLQRTVSALDGMLAPALTLNRPAVVALVVLYGLVVLWIGFGELAWTSISQQSDQPAPVKTSDSQIARAGQTAGALVVGLLTPLLLIEVFTSRERVAVDLLKSLDRARFESPEGMRASFSVITEVINGRSLPALFAHPPSKVSWNLTVPEGRSVLKTGAALRPYVWEGRSDGVQFDIFVTDGTQEQHVSKLVNPRINFGERAWNELDVDLSPFAGRAVTVRFETSAGPSGDPGWDWAMWGAPRIVASR